MKSYYRTCYSKKKNKSRYTVMFSNVSACSHVLVARWIYIITEKAVHIYTSNRI